jgi:LmbE family N-acetylglucosaminyl deacetylase
MSESMERRQFIERTLAASAAFGAATSAASAATAAQPASTSSVSPPSPPPPTGELISGGGGGTSYQLPITVERRREGKPHRGKVLAAIQPHCDDIPIYAGGTVLKLLDEGYEGILITMTDDSMAGTGRLHGEIAARNEVETIEVARRMGLKQSIFLNYPNHNMDAWPVVEMRARLVFLFRAFKVDTVLTYDPSGLYERNPDHYVGAKAVESACWMARSAWDYPEHLAAGLKVHGPADKYYFSRGPQLVNRVVDIGDFMDQKVWVNLANVTQGPAGNSGVNLRARLAAEGKRLPLLDGTDEQANRAYAKEFALARDRQRAVAYGLQYAEYFHYSPPDESAVDAYVRANAVRL